MGDRFHERCLLKQRSFNGAFDGQQDPSRLASLVSVSGEGWRCNRHHMSRSVLVLFRLAHASNNYGDGESDPPTVGQPVEFDADDGKIGSAAVVTRDVTQGSVVVVNPAREVARNALAT